MLWFRQKRTTLRFFFHFLSQVRIQRGRFDLFQIGNISITYLNFNSLEFFFCVFLTISSDGISSIVLDVWRAPHFFSFLFFLVKKNQSTRKKMKEEEITQPMKRFLLFSLWWKRGNVLHQMSALWRVNEAGPRGFPIRHGAAKVIFRFIFLFFPFFFGVSLPCFFFLFFLFIFA